MNQDQWMALLRVLLAAGGPVVAMLISFGIPADQASTLTSSILAIAGAAGPVISLIWGLIKNSNSGKLAAVEKMPDVKIQVGPAAPAAAQDAAMDLSRPNIVIAK